MKKSLVYVWCRVAVAASVCLVAVVVGCNSDQPANDQSNSGNEPSPEGKGTLVLDNLTSDTINVFVTGVQTSIVDAVSESFVYLAPGLYRVVLAQDGGVRNYRDDVDVLLGRHTILHIDNSLTNANFYSVVMEFN